MTYAIPQADVRARAKQPGIYGRGVAFVLIASAALVFLFWRNDRMYWPYVVLAYVIGGLVYFWEVRRHPGVKMPSLWSYLFPKEVWLHPATANDALLALITFFALVMPERHYLFGSHVAKQVAYFLSLHVHAFAHGQAAPVPGTGVIIAYTFIAWAMADLFYYVSHRLTHTVPMLWEFHKVHHAAPVMTPLTLYRLHPFDWIFNGVARQFGILLTGCVFFYFYPGIRTIFLIAGINAFYFLTDLMGRNLRHSHIWLSFGPAVEHVFISPAQHQIHHSIEKKHINKNYGSIFSVWDWMFGSLYVPKEKENITFGLGGAKIEAPYYGLLGMLFEPFKQFRKKKA